VLHFENKIFEIFAFLGSTQRRVVFSYRRFGTTCQPHFQRLSSPFLGLGLQYCPYFETCATINYVYFTKVFFSYKTPDFTEVGVRLRLD